MKRPLDPQLPAGPAGAPPPSATAPAHALGHDQRRARRPYTDRRLSRSRTDRVIGGVCAGLAQFIGVRTSSVRLLYAVSAVLSIGTTAVLYLLLWALIPGGTEGST